MTAPLFRSKPAPPGFGWLDAADCEVLLKATTDVERGMRLHACAKEPWTDAWIKQMPPGSLLFDVGANVGSYTLLAARRGVKVVAFEPVPANIATLMDNTLMNMLEQLVILMPYALGATTGFDKMGLPHSYGSGVAGVGWGDKINPQQHRDTPTTVWKLDDLRRALALPAPNFLKLDVDGKEVDVLTGAQETLNDPALVSCMVEMQRDYRDQTIRQLLLGAGFKQHAVHEMRNGRIIAGVKYTEFRREPAKEQAA